MIRLESLSTKNFKLKMNPFTSSQITRATCQPACIIKQAEGGGASCTRLQESEERSNIAKFEDPIVWKHGNVRHSFPFEPDQFATLRQSASRFTALSLHSAASKLMAKFVFLVLLGLLMLSVPTVVAWGATGHQIIGAIAQHFLSLQVRFK